MDRDNLELISKAIAQIREIDRRIDNIKKMATIAADKPIDSFLKMSIKDISISPINESSFTHDYYKSLMNYLEGTIQISQSPSSAKKNYQKQEADISIKLKPDNCTTLKILEILLKDIVMERNHYKNQLKRIGVEI